MYMPMCLSIIKSVFSCLVRTWMNLGLLSDLIKGYYDRVVSTSLKRVLARLVEQLP
jgi:hypothetical protein